MVTLILPMRFQINCFSVQEKFKIDFQDLGFLIGMLWGIFFTNILILPIRFWVSWHFGPGEVHNRFSRSWISDRNALRDFFSYTLILPIRFWVSWHFGSGKVQNRFSKWCWASWISSQNDFSYKTTNTCYQLSSQLAFQFRKGSSKHIYKMGAVAAIVDFWVNFNYFFI